jgi:hypothetical protein
MQKTTLTKGGHTVTFVETRAGVVVYDSRKSAAEQMGRYGAADWCASLRRSGWELKK